MAQIQYMMYTFLVIPLGTSYINRLHFNDANWYQVCAHSK